MFTSPRFLGACVYALAFVAGFNAFTEKWSGVTAFSAPFRPRNPAAFKELDDFTRLQGVAMLNRVREHLVTTTRIHRTEDTANVQLAHFIIRNPTGGPSLAACDLYEKVVLRFEADGVFVYGHTDKREPAAGDGIFQHQKAHEPERPTMIVEGTCFEDLNNTDYFAPIKIPVRMLQKNHSAPVALKDYIFNENLKIRFRTPTNTWPERWTLTAIELRDSDEIVEDLTVSIHEIRQLASPQQQKNLRFSWSL